LSLASKIRAVEGRLRMVSDRDRRTGRLLGLALVFALLLGASAFVTIRELEASKATKDLAAQLPEDCPPGTAPMKEEEYTGDPAALPPEYRGPKTEFPGWAFGGCPPMNHGESFQDLALRDLQASSVRTAGLGFIPENANLTAAKERRALERLSAKVAGAAGKAAQYGKGPLIFTDDRYGQASGTGIVHATGRIDDLKYDKDTGRMFAAIGTGGIWMSGNLGKNWKPLTDDLPSTVASGVAYTRAGGPKGTILMITGEHTFGGNAYTGIGAFYSRNLGKTWKHAKGVPGGSLGFAIEADRENPKVVYAATGKGLYRSTDAGETYKDVKLPTGQCAGKYKIAKCHFANFVTDVVVKEPKGTGADKKGTDVVAVVGWRAGRFEDPDGFVQSPKNGVYTSKSGKPGTFKYQDGLATAAGGQERLGRIELGPASGTAQDHNYLYAVVEDAVLFNGGFRAIEVLEEDDPLGNATVLNGIYSSDDFGVTWTQLADDVEMSQVCPLNQSVYCIPGLIEPGAQSWYNMWILPDPTKADPVTGVPTRLVMGLEEVWQTEINSIPQNTPATSFQVIGAYYGSADCLLVATNCAVNEVADVNTTHPDQHSGLFIPKLIDQDEESGDVTLYVGNDGGLARQDATQIDDFDQNSWLLRQKNSLQTLLPYSAVWANDGTAYAGLQDNGTLRLSPEDDFKQFETIGADGTFAAVAPKNSDYAFEAIQGGLMNVTTDGGQTWRDVEPPASTKRFVNPFVMDPTNSNHITTGGREINETLAGPNVADGDAANDWVTVFDLGFAPAVTGAPPPTPPNSMTAIDTRGHATYVGYCGPCDLLNTPYPFKNGIATNVGGSKKPKAGTGNGWHKVKPKGLPNRFITSVAIDPRDRSKKTVYATLGGYSRQWVGPGTLNDVNKNIGTGHVFKSTDAGKHWTNVSKRLPDIPALWVEPKGKQLIVGTDQGAYISGSTKPRTPWAPLKGLPATPIQSIQLKPNNSKIALIGSYGRGLWTYRFGKSTPPKLPGPLVRIAPSNPNPAKGKTITFRTRLFRCTKSGAARKALSGTTVRLQRKTGDGFETLAAAAVDGDCRASFKRKANFKEAQFRAKWAKQSKNFRAGTSGLVTIRTH
jgi:photosystem II stability/assembly factor-like uncharacterized protein